MEKKTLPEMIATAEHAVFMRRRLYPKAIGAGMMSQEYANHEVASMEAIVTTLKELERAERLFHIIHWLRRTRAKGRRDRK